MQKKKKKGIFFIPNLSQNTDVTDRVIQHIFGQCIIFLL